MKRTTDRHFRFDWICILLYLTLVAFGWINIISASSGLEEINYLNITQPYGKQLFFIGLSIVLIVLIFSFESQFFVRFSSIIYITSITSLLGLFLFGKSVNGAMSWYGIGGFTIQPSEFAKTATALAVAKYISDIEFNVKSLKSQLILLLIVFIPAFLILLQNDAGSTIVYTSFFFVIFREGLPKIFLFLGASLIALALASLKFGVKSTGVIIFIGVTIYFIVNGLKKRQQILKYTLTLIFSIVFTQLVTIFYTYALQTHHKNRISVWLRLEKDPVKLQQMKKDIAYNLHQSEEAISVGNLYGKGFMEGTRTTGKFIPEQHTDYIFSTVGEEWGFLGCTLVVILFGLLLIRILYLAEQQKTTFSRVYGYGVASVLFIHFLINIGMVMGLIPTVGIPLPFFSYGGSSLWGFTILLFIFLKLDSNKINEW